MTRKEAFDEINKIQDDYIEELVGIITNSDYAPMKSIDFTSATGTGKSKIYGEK